MALQSPDQCQNIDLPAYLQVGGDVCELSLLGTQWHYQKKGSSVVANQDTQSHI